MENNSHPRSGVIYRFEAPTGAPIENPGPFGPSRLLEPFVPTPLDPASLIGRTIDELTTSAGTYGMGGPGFLGLRLGDEWLILSIWGAAEWVLVGGRPIEDVHEQFNGGREAWNSAARGDRLSPVIIGTSISGLDLQPRSLAMDLSNGMRLEVAEDPATRPIFAGSRQPRILREDDDLRRALFLPPTIELWV